MATTWTPSSWRSKPILQVPTYGDAALLASTEQKLSSLPPLVTAGEVRKLKSALAKAVTGEAFLLQGGDCAEAFAEFNTNHIRDTFKLILQMAVSMTFGAQVPIIKVGRMAGQFAKPRSADTETKDGVTLPSYRGDIVNMREFTAEARVPNPLRMLDAYHQSSSSLNFVRGLASGGFANLAQIHRWNLDFTRQHEQEQYAKLAEDVERAIAFMEAIGINPDSTSNSRKLISTPVTKACCFSTRKHCVVKIAQMAAIMACQAICYGLVTEPARRTMRMLNSCVVSKTPLASNAARPWNRMT